MKIDLTPILEALIAVLAALITYRLIPWIKTKTSEKQQENLKTAAGIAVLAAEQIYGSGQGEAKLNYAVNAAQETLGAAGIWFDWDVVRTAVENAVAQLNIVYANIEAASEEAEEEEEE